MFELRGLVILFVFSIALLLTACETNESQVVKKQKSEEVVTVLSEIEYEVISFDWLFGNTARLCNDDECIDLNLHDAGHKIRSEVQPKKIIRITEIETKKGNRKYTDYEYEYVE